MGWAATGNEAASADNDAGDRARAAGQVEAANGGNLAATVISSRPRNWSYRP
jgi:hypothetical protein